MRSLHSIRPGTITVERPSALANSLLFAPILGAITVLPWFASPTTSSGPIVTTLLGAAWLVGAAVLGLRRTRIDIPVSSRAVLVLVQSDDGLDASYRVVLEDGERSELLLEHDDPARALEDLRRIQRELALEVRPGWGLSADALGQPDECGPAQLARIDVEGLRWQAQRRTALASCAGSLFILAVTAYTFAKVAAPASSLARFLPGLFALLIALASLLLLTLRIRVRLADEGLRVETSMLYLSFKNYEVSAREILRADAVAAGRHGAQHVLLQTTGGARAIPLSGPAAEVLARGIVLTPREARAAEVPWAKLPRDHAVSMEENPC